MAEAHKNELGGFANRQFLLINGRTWDSNVTRRYMQGQAWLTEFTGILLQCLLQIYCMELATQPLCTGSSFPEGKGSLEILKYARQFPHGIELRKSRQRNSFLHPRDIFRMRFVKDINGIRSLRNEMTHEIEVWNGTSDNLQELLEKIITVLEKIVECFGPDVDLRTRVLEFLGKCESEHHQIRHYPHLY